MRFTVNIDPAALADLRALRAYDRKAIFDTIERILTTAPTQVSRSRIKRLRGIDSPQYRLRVSEFRVREVYVMRVLTKIAAAEYLRELGYEIEDRERGTTRDPDAPSGE